MLNLNNLNANNSGGGGEVINSLYNLLENDGNNVKWLNDNNIMLIRPSGLSNINKIRFREFVGDLLPVVKNGTLPKLMVSLKTVNNPLLTGQIITPKDIYSNHILLSQYCDILNVELDWQYNEAEESQVAYNIKLALDVLNSKLKRMLQPLTSIIYFTDNDDFVENVIQREAYTNHDYIVLPSGLFSNIVEYSGDVDNILRFPYLDAQLVKQYQTINYGNITQQITGIEYNNQHGAVGLVITQQSLQNENSLSLYAKLGDTETVFNYTLQSGPKSFLYNSIKKYPHQTGISKYTVGGTTKYYSYVVTSPGDFVISYKTSDALYERQNLDLLEDFSDIGVPFEWYDNNNPFYIISFALTYDEANSKGYIDLVVAFDRSRPDDEDSGVMIAYLKYDCGSANPITTHINSPTCTICKYQEIDTSSVEQINTYDSHLLDKLSVLCGSVGLDTGYSSIASSPVNYHKLNSFVWSETVITTDDIEDETYPEFANSAIIPNYTITTDNTEYAICWSHSNYDGDMMVNVLSTDFFTLENEFTSTLTNKYYPKPGASYSGNLYDCGDCVQSYVYDSISYGYIVPNYVIEGEDLNIQYNYIGARPSYVFGAETVLNHVVVDSSLYDATGLNRTSISFNNVSNNDELTLETDDLITYSGIYTDGVDIIGSVQLPVLNMRSSEGNFTVPTFLHIDTSPSVFEIFSEIQPENAKPYSIYKGNANLLYKAVDLQVLSRLETQILFKYEYNDIILNVLGFPNGDGVLYHLNDISRIRFKELQTDNTTTSIIISLTQDDDKIDIETLKYLYGKLYLSVDWEQ